MDLQAQLIFHPEEHTSSIQIVQANEFSELAVPISGARTYMQSLIAASININTNS